MAITATFKADFQDFFKAVEKAEDVLVDLSKGANKVDASLKRMVDGFSGRKLVQEATLTAAAVEAIGGTSKLTEKELARVSAQATEAANKLRALGKDVPPGIQKLADATLNVGEAAKKSTSLLSGMGLQLAKMFTIAAVVAFGKQVLTAGDQIQKMADQTGLTVEEVQKLQHIAGQSGTSIESLVGLCRTSSSDWAIRTLARPVRSSNSGSTWMS